MPKQTFPRDPHNPGSFMTQKDDRGDKFRSVINIYSRTARFPQYPTLVSASRPPLMVAPIPFAALSGLSPGEAGSMTLYAVEDSFYRGSRIFTIDAARQVADADVTSLHASDSVMSPSPPWSPRGPHCHVVITHIRILVILLWTPHMLTPHANPMSVPETY